MARHTPITERHRLISQWRQSPHHQPMSAFARSIGVPPSTFARWAREVPEDLSPSAFVELTPVEVPEVGSQDFSLRLEGSGQVDVQLLFEAPPPPS